jgi:site-specific recombinase XerD
MVKSTDFAECVEEYFTSHLSGKRNLSANTIKSYRDTFVRLLYYAVDERNLTIEKIKIKDIDDKLVTGFIDWLEDGRENSITTRNQRLAAIHAFFRHIQPEHPELLLHCQRILAIPMKKQEKKVVNYISENAVKEMLALPDQNDKYGLRDTALLCLLYDSGARISELIELSLGDLRLEYPTTVRLLGKGRKARTVPLMHQTADIILKYISRWGLDLNRMPDTPLFINHHGNRLTRPGVTYILNKYMSQVKSEGYDGRTITPHVIRHTKAMHLLRANINLNYIRDFLGHVDISTTEVYAKADAEMKRKAFEKANIELPVENQTSWQKNDNLLSWLINLGK